MTTSIERDVENQTLSAITTAGVTGVNLYTSERASGRIPPFISAIAKITGEELQQFTGIFSGQLTLSYGARADSISRQAFDAKYISILEAFYTTPNIASQMTSASPNLTFYISDIQQCQIRVLPAKRIWIKDLIFNFKVTAK